MSPGGTHPSARSRRHVAALLAAAVVVLATPPSSYAHLAQSTYATGVAGVGGVFSTGGFNHRDYNQVWHQAGKKWTVLYELTNGSPVAIVTNTDNPTRWGGEIGYAKAKCNNVNDNSFVTWTCQTTGGG